MRQIFMIVGLIVFLTSLSGQDSTCLSFEQYYISINRTTLNDYNSKNNFGFGFGAKILFRKDKKFNLVFGLEYNRTSFLMKSIYEGHFSISNDVTYKMSCFSVPFSMRLTFGNKTKLYFEPGLFADLVLGSTREGTNHSYKYIVNEPILYHTTQFNEKANLSSSIGVFFGIGVRIPLSKVELIVNPEYKFGINDIYSYLDTISNRYFKINFGIKF